MPAAIAPIAGAVIGGVMNKGNKGGSSQTTTNEPWGPAQPLIEDYLKQNQQLNGYYQKNPFNAQQQTGYQNLFSDLDNFRNNISPQLQALNNQLLGANYQRAPAGTELGSRAGYIDPSQFLPGAQSRGQMSSAGGNMAGAMGGGSGGMGGGLMQAISDFAGPAIDRNQSVQSFAQAYPQGGGEASPAGGLLGGQAAAQQALTGLLGANIPITAGGGNYGTINWAAQNPWTNELKPEPTPVEKKPVQTTDEMLEDWYRRRNPQAYQEWENVQRFGNGGA